MDEKVAGWGVGGGTGADLLMWFNSTVKWVPEAKCAAYTELKSKPLMTCYCCVCVLVCVSARVCERVLEMYGNMRLVHRG